MPDAGWYPDPMNARHRRWWDGNAWTEHTTPGASRSARMLESPPRELASPWRRLAARALDAVILGIVMIPLFAIYVAPNIHVTRQNGTISGVSGARPSLALVLLLAAINFAYEVGMVATLGATIGKMIVGIRVERDDGSSVGWGGATVRWFVYSGVALIPFVGTIASVGIFLVSVVIIFTDARRQTVWDKAAKTIVVRPRGAETPA